MRLAPGQKLFRLFCAVNRFVRRARLRGCDVAMRIGASRRGRTMRAPRAAADIWTAIRLYVRASRHFDAYRQHATRSTQCQHLCGLQRILGAAGGLAMGHDVRMARAIARARSRACRSAPRCCTRGVRGYRPRAERVEKKISQGADSKRRATRFAQNCATFPDAKKKSRAVFAAAREAS